MSWIKAHLVNPYAITAAATVLLVFVPFIIWALDRRRRTDSAEPSAKDRAVMLQRVRNKWITGVLEPSLADAEHLDLGLHRRPGAINYQDQAVRRQSRPTTSAAGKTISKIFDEVGGGLLILGVPGAGKTTLLLQLAEALLDRADADPSEPIPVVADLSSWANREQPLAAWLTEEVAVRQYRVPSKAFSYWLARNKIALLLDGLDEIDAHQRDACAEAINTFRHEQGLTGIAVCCLTSEAEKLATRLELEEAIELEAPTDTQVSSYLDHVEATGIPATDIRTAIAEDDDLRGLLRSPLMLRVVTRACQGIPGKLLQQTGTTEARLQRLWDEYMESMFQRRPAKKSARYPEQQEISWLEWLASALETRSETEFYLDRLTVDWLPSGTRERWRSVEYLSGVLAEFIRPVERLHWSWSKLKSRFHDTRSISGGISLLATLALAFPGILVAMGGSDITALNQSVPFILSGTALGLCCVAIVILSLGWTTELRDTRAVPNEGIKRSARNGLVLGLSAALLFGLIFGLTDEHIFKLGNVLIFGVVTGLTVGLFVALVFGLGACLAHYVIRALLVWSGAAPWRYQRFLEAMTDRQLMRRSGACYLFVHRLLRDHLADHVTDGSSHSRSTAVS